MTTVEDSVRKWLDSQGFPLELRVADILRKCGVSADHYRCYTDPISAKLREIDVVGYLDNPSMSVHLVVECKHSLGRPWVLFCTKHPPLTRAGFVSAVPGTKKAIELLQNAESREDLTRMRIFDAPDLLGFRLVRSQTDNQDAAFHAVLGLTAACNTTANWIGKFDHSVLYVPVLVVDSPLLRCHLDSETGELCLDRVSYGTLLHKPAEGSHILIQVVHIDALSEFVNQVKGDTVHLGAMVRAS